MAKDEYLIIDSLRREASRLIDQGYYEDAIPKLNQCFSLEEDPNGRAAILCELGFCLVSVGWYEDAVKLFCQYLEAYPLDNDARFYLASAYASMGWADESMAELRKILASDPTDILACHALALCYRDRGWLIDSLEIMKAARNQAVVYGTQEEKEIVEESLASLEKEIEEGEKDKLKEGALLAILLAILKGKKEKLP